MSFDAKVDLEDLQALEKLFPSASRGAARRAHRSELFRLKVEAEKDFREGIAPDKAPLTRALTRGGRALRWFAQMIAYEQTAEADGFTGTVGLTAQAARRRSAPDVAFLAPLFEGRGMRVTEAMQARIAERLRARGVPEARLAKMIPYDGERVYIPRRDAFGGLLADEAEPKSLRNVAALYQQALEGKRWKSRFWEGGEE